MDSSPRLDTEAKEPLYMQLYQYFREEITSNRLPSGKRLPSIRRLANNLQVSKATAEMAYQQLLAEGYVESRERSGYYVVPLNGEMAAVTLASASPLFVSEQRTEHPTFRYDFHLSSIDGTLFPFAVWRKLTNRCLQPEETTLLGYGERQGERELRQLISLYLRQSRGVNCTADQIVIGAGTQTLLSLLCQMLSSLDKRIAMEDPGYQDVRYVCQNHGFQAIPISLAEDGIDVDRLAQSGAKIVYITPSHQYPTGMVMSISRRMKLLQWAEETGGLILEDDYDGEFRYRGRPIPSLQGLDHGNHVVYLGTFSKSLMPSLRISYMVLPDTLLPLFREKLWMYEQTVSRIHQRTLQLFMQSGEWERHIRRMRTVYQKKHAFLLQTIKQVMKDAVHITGQDAGLHMALEVRTKKTAEELVRLAASAGVRVYSVYSMKEMVERQEPFPQILLGFGGLQTDELEAGIRLLHDAWNPYYQAAE